MDKVLEKSKYESINREEALFVFKETEDENNAQKLFKTARYVRNKVKGDTFKWSAGIARVLKCNLKPLCRYCPYWRNKTQQQLTVDEIIKAVGYIVKHGIKEFHLSGGTTLGSEGKDVLNIVKAIRNAGYEDVTIDVNCGAAMSLKTLEELRNLGVKKVSAVFETINEDLFKKMKPGDNLTEKKKFAELIGQAGLKLGTGILAGLSPEESKYEDYVDFIFYIKKYKHLDSVYVSKFYPFEGTDMKNCKPCSDIEAVRVISMLRLVLRNVDISSAQGWTRNNNAIPLMAGAGNKVLGIHITRTPFYKINSNINSPYSSYKDNLEYCDCMSVCRDEYLDHNMTLE